MIIKLKQEAGVNKLEEEIFGNQLKNLYNSIHALSNKKFVEDKFNFELESSKQNYHKLDGEKGVIQEEVKALIHDRDRLRVDLQDVVKSRLMIMKDKELYAKGMKEKTSQLENQLQKKTDDLEKKTEVGQLHFTLGIGLLSAWEVIQVGREWAW